jgi:anthranilate synthase/aminodeoxychorismate synthase-like glutamine amidotransferase
MLLMIDNYDSFTYNLVHYFCELGADVRVFRNDAITVEAIEDLDPQAIVLSPGPCSPNEAGVSLEVVRCFAGKRPMLGVCLGMQAMVQALGGDIVRASRVMHGKTSAIEHTGRDLFRNLKSPLRVTRYHSLVADRNTLPKELEETAWTLTDDGQREYVMAVRHRTWPLWGVQFHPEAVLTEQGHQLLANFLSRLVD